MNKSMSIQLLINNNKNFRNTAHHLPSPTDALSLSPCMFFNLFQLYFTHWIYRRFLCIYCNFYLIFAKITFHCYATLLLVQILFTNRAICNWNLIANNRSYAIRISSNQFKYKLTRPFHNHYSHWLAIMTGNTIWWSAAIMSQLLKLIIIIIIIIMVIFKCYFSGELIALS